jgi:hypothetical protein
MDVLVPPLSVLVAATAAGSVASLALAVVTRRPNLASVLFGASAVFLLAYGVRGWQVSGTGLRGLTSLAYAPGYMAWKASLRLRRRGQKAGGEWVRTARTGEVRG